MTDTMCEEDILTKSHRSTKNFNAIFRILGVFLFIALIINVVLMYKVITHSEWDPLGAYPIQLITNQQETTKNDDGIIVTNPTIHIPSDVNAIWPTVNIEATKCADEEVKVKGQSFWRQVEPPGFSYENPGGIATRSLGCQSFHYKNDFPPEIRNRIANLANNGTNITIWQIGGEETPVNDEGGTGGPRLYQSQNFTVVYGP